jgi:hypothetical protein
MNAPLMQGGYHLTGGRGYAAMKGR